MADETLYWHSDLAATLWVMAGATALLYGGLCALGHTARRLAVLAVPYLGVISLLALTATDILTASAMSKGPTPPAWLYLHIGVSVITYAGLTLAALTALAVTLQERALKRKTTSALSRRLPPVVASERLMVRLLMWCEAVLGAGLATGLATAYYQHGGRPPLDHKVLLSIATFFLIGGLLFAQMRTGLSGRQAARLSLIAFLLLTLAYPGVKLIRVLASS